MVTRAEASLIPMGFNLTFLKKKTLAVSTIGTVISVYGKRTADLSNYVAIYESIYS